MATIDDCQSLVVTGHGRLPYSAALWWAFPEEDEHQEGARRLLERLSEHVDYGVPDSDRKKALQLAFSAEGLARLGVGADALAACGRTFTRGIITARLARALGDRGENAPKRWAWSDRHGHVLVLVYACTATVLDDQLSELDAWREEGRLTEVARVATEVSADAREPFGFRDGISNVRPRLDGGKPRPDDDEVAPGEVVLGLRDALGVKVSHGWLGDGGSFLVARQLEQNVEAFWSFWRDRGRDDRHAVWLASKAVGRWPNGMPISGSEPSEQPPADEARIFGDLDFGADRFGDACPIGAHIRRAHPRMGLSPDDPERSKRANATHRLLRRGRRYGPPAPASWFPPEVANTSVAHPDADHDAERGLLFLALVGDIARQFEFVQHTWLNNSRFSTLSSGTDPIAAGRQLSGDEGVFILPGLPARRRVKGLGSWVTVRGGGYYLLPSRVAIERLVDASPK